MYVRKACGGQLRYQRPRSQFFLAPSDWASECREKAPNTEILSRMAIYNFRVWNFLIKYLNGKNKNENNATLKKQKQTSDKGNWNNCFERNSHFLFLFLLLAREKNRVEKLLWHMAEGAGHGASRCKFRVASSKSAPKQQTKKKSRKTLISVARGELVAICTDRVWSLESRVDGNGKPF